MSTSIDFGRSPLFRRLESNAQISEDFSTEVPGNLDERAMQQKHDELLENLSELMLEVGFGFRLTQQMSRGDAGKTSGRVALLA